ncbi:flagellin [Rhodobacter sp.]
MVSRVGHGDASLTAILSRQSATLRAEIEKRSTELVSGLHHDMGAAVRGDYSALSAVEQSLARLKGYAATTAEAALYTDAMQNALGVIADGAADLGTDILRAVGPTSEISLDSVVIAAGRTFSTAVAALNTRFSERAVFSGVNSDASPLPGAEAILTALDAVVAGATTDDDIRTAIAGWFSNPAGYDALYAGGAARPGLPVAAGDVAQLDVTAVDPAIRDTLQALATAAMLDRGLLAGQPKARLQLMRSAGEALLTGGEARVQLRARVGSVQAQIAAAQSRNGAEKSALEIARAGMVSPDPYDTATILEDLQARLESLYLVTARVSRLSLADYI